MENVTSKTYRILNGSLVVLEQTGQPILNTGFEKGLRLDMNLAYVKGESFVGWVRVDLLEMPYSTFYWKGN